MSRRKSKHRIKIKKTRGFWEVRCTCGYYQGNHHKDDAVRQAAEHNWQHIGFQ